MSTLNVATIKSNTSNPPLFQNTSGTEIGTLCRAWVNFNGTGTVAIRAQYNVSSITDNGTGAYRANFTTAMPDVNYAATIGGGLTADANTNIRFPPASMTTSDIFVSTVASSNAAAKDLDVVCIAVFR
jgi:hypothetical protein